MKRHLVLTGLPGSGKTTVGRRVAELLGAAFTDLDDTVVLATGRTVAEIFATLGEPRFRELERAAMDGALAAPHHVIAPGAGWIAQADNLEAAERAGAVVVCLRVAPEVAASRLVGDASRPLLANEDRAGQIRALLHVRDGWYRRASSHVDGGGRPEAVAESVARIAREKAGW